MLEDVTPTCGLHEASWEYISKTALDDMRKADWEILERQRKVFYAERQADEVIALLTVGENEPSFGYQINNFQHCLQSATMVERAGYGQEDIVVALLHDIGFVACPSTHGRFAAELLRSYVSERNYWMLSHHQSFQKYHRHEYPCDRDERERWRDSPYFDWTAEFVARFDQNAQSPSYGWEPLEHFIPLVRSQFSDPGAIRP